MLRRAVELEPPSYDHLFALGDFLLRRGRNSEAAALAERMAALDPARPEAAQLRRLATGR